MSNIVISIEDLSKRYRLGSLGGRTFRQDTARWWAKQRGRPDPYLRIGQKAPSGQDGETVWALRDINLQIREGEILGIIGRNGAGKSTLLKIVSRITAPTTGVVKVKGRIGSLLEVGTGFHPELTGRENVYLNGAILGMTRAEVARKFDEIVDFSGVEQYIDTPVKRYSSGMQVRLAFAVAAHLEPEILVVDEVLAVGDAEFQEKCIGKMQDVSSQGRTVLFVSHNMASIKRLCNRAVLIDEGTLAYEGSPETTTVHYLSGSQVDEGISLHGPVKHVAVYHENDALHMHIQYESEVPIKLPNVGFLIRDYWGNAVCGTNASDAGVRPLAEPRRNGTAKVTIVSPKFRTGTYRLSLWFGDGRQDYFKAPDLATFTVVNTTGVRERPNDDNGSVVPECTWSFLP